MDTNISKLFAQKLCMERGAIFVWLIGDVSICQKSINVAREVDSEPCEIPPKRTLFGDLSKSLPSEKFDNQLSNMHRPLIDFLVIVGVCLIGQ